MNSFFKVISSLILALSINAYGCDAQEPIEQLVSKLSVSDSSLSFTETDGYNTITTIGTIKNQSSLDIEDLVVEVKYFDQQGKKIDVVTQSLYGIVVPAKEEVDFRVRDQADKTKSNYATSTARIVSAEEKCSPKSKKKRSYWVELLISWAPMLLFLGLWYLLIRGANGKKSPQRQMIVLIEKQTEILKQQADAIERIANSAERAKNES